MSQAMMAVPITSIIKLSVTVYHFAPVGVVAHVVPPNTMHLEFEVIWAASFAGFYWWTNSFGYTPSIHDILPGGIIAIWYGGI